MEPVIVVIGATSAVGALLSGLGALWSGRARKEAAQANAAVNRQPPGAPSISQRVDLIGDSLHDVGRDVRSIDRRLGRVERRVHTVEETVEEAVN